MKEQQPNKEMNVAEALAMLFMTCEKEGFDIEIGYSHGRYQEWGESIVKHDPNYHGYTIMIAGCSYTNPFTKKEYHYKNIGNMLQAGFSLIKEIKDEREED